jgi:hypothetical protein
MAPLLGFKQAEKERLRSMKENVSALRQYLTMPLFVKRLKLSIFVLLLGNRQHS